MAGRKQRGVALVTAMFISLILTILGLAFLTFISNDYAFSGAEQNTTAAFYLAVAGYNYMHNSGDASKFPLNLPDANHQCIKGASVVNNVTYTTYTGVVKNAFATLGRRTIVDLGPGQWVEQGRQ